MTRRIIIESIYEYSGNTYSVREDEVLTDKSDPYGELLRKEGVEEIEYALSKLSIKDRRILAQRFGFNGKQHSLQEVGTSIGMSRQGVRQRQVVALGQARRIIESRRRELQGEDSL